jgi:hypothetical protein
VLLLESGLEFELVMEFVFKYGCKLGWADKLRCSSRGVQSGCCAFLVSIFRWSKPPHHIKVNPLGEECKVVSFYL